MNNDLYLAIRSNFLTDLSEAIDAAGEECEEHAVAIQDGLAYTLASTVLIIAGVEDTTGLAHDLARVAVGAMEKELARITESN